MTTALTPYEEPRSVVTFDAARLELLRNTIAKGTNDDQFALFVEVARRTGLDPFAKQIYAVMRKTRAQVNGQWVDVPEMTIQTGIDGYRLICQRAGNYAGMDGPYWCGADGDWRDTWFDDEPPKAAKVGVRASGDSDWTYHVAMYREYVQMVGKDAERKPNSMWSNMPANQLAKCAEAGARRKRWAVDLANVYVDAEAGTARYVTAAAAEQQIEYETSGPKAIKPPKRKSEKAKDVVVTGDGEIVDPVLRTAAQAVVINTGADVQERQSAPATVEKRPPTSNPPKRMPEEVTDIAPASDAAFGVFWNSLPDALERLGKSLGDVAMVLNVEPSAIGLKKWFKACKGDPMTVIEEALAHAAR